MTDQQAIPDRLVAVRAQIAALKVEEAALRTVLLADPAARLGANYIATIKRMVSYRVRSKDLEKADPALFAQLATETAVDQIYLTKRASPDDVSSGAPHG